MGWDGIGKGRSAEAVSRTQTNSNRLGHVTHEGEGALFMRWMRVGAGFMAHPTTCDTMKQVSTPITVPDFKDYDDVSARTQAQSHASELQCSLCTRQQQ